MSTQPKIIVGRAATKLRKMARARGKNWDALIKTRVHSLSSSTRHKKDGMATTTIGPLLSCTARRYKEGNNNTLLYSPLITLCLACTVVFWTTHEGNNNTLLLYYQARLDHPLPGLAALQAGLEHARRAGRVDLGRSDLHLDHGCFAEASDGQQSLKTSKTRDGKMCHRKFATRVAVRVQFVLAE